MPTRPLVKSAVVFLSVLASCATLRSQTADVGINSKYSELDAGDGLKAYSVHFSGTRPYGYQGKVIETIRLLTASPYLIACGELKRHVVQTGAGVFSSGLFGFNSRGEFYDVELDQDNISHGSSTVEGDIEILGAVDPGKCPKTVKPFTIVVQYAPSTAVARAKEAASLPLEKTYSKHVSYSVPPNGQIQDQGVFISVDNDLYTFCRENLSLALSGEVKMSRVPAEGVFYYTFQLWPDIVWHQPSAVEGDINIVATTDREKSKCKPFAEAFPPIDRPSPSHGWESQTGYVFHDYGRPAQSQEIVFASPLPNYEYCGHRIHVNTAVGKNWFYPSDWTSKGITIVEVAGANEDNYPLEDDAASLGLTVYVKWVPDRSKDPSCGPIPAQPRAHAKPNGEPNDFWYFTPD